MRYLSTMIIFFFSMILIAQLSYSQTGTTSDPQEFTKPDGHIRADSSGQTLISGVPWYQLQHGDGPTALGMLMGYWDSHGFRHLIPGDALVANNTIRELIASDNNDPDCDNTSYSDHYRDYACPLDPNSFPPQPDKSQLGGAHSDNCIADFLGTSRSSLFLRYKQSLATNFPIALTKYMDMMAPQYDHSIAINQYDPSIFWDPAWELFKDEIDANRPVIISWNLEPGFPNPYDANPGSEWDMIAFGYQVDEYGQKLFAWHTDYSSDTLWIEWDWVPQLGPWYPEPILSMITYRPLYTPKTIHVPADFTTIQEAIDFADEGDTILVADGIYTGFGNVDITLEGRPVLLSENGPEVTIIDCGGSASEPHSAFLIENDVGPETKIIGFTIRNGYNLGHGGAISCLGSSPSIENCIFVNNTAEKGGAIFIENSASPEILGCFITENSADDGGGIYFGQYSEAIVENCTITRNSAANGGGLFNNSSTPEIKYCIISDNNAEYGGGFYNSRRGGKFSNCNICLNDAEFGSGLAFSIASNSVEIVNSIIAFNTSGTAIYCPDPSRVPALHCTDIFANDDGDWTGGIAPQQNLNNNFSANPMFCDAVIGDYGLYFSSPCSPANSTCGTLIGAIDIGCESEFICGDANFDGEINVTDIIYVIDYYFNGGPRPIPYIAADPSCNGWVDLVDILHFNDYLFNQQDFNCCLNK